jgi:hypothetical protein
VSLIDRFDPAIVTGPREHGLLHIIEPGEAADRPAAEKPRKSSRSSGLEQRILKAVERQRATIPPGRRYVRHLGDIKTGTSKFRSFGRNGRA